NAKTHVTRHEWRLRFPGDVIDMFKARTTLDLDDIAKAFGRDHSNARVRVSLYEKIGYDRGAVGEPGDSTWRKIRHLKDLLDPINDSDAIVPRCSRYFQGIEFISVLIHEN